MWAPLYSLAYMSLILMNNIMNIETILRLCHQKNGQKVTSSIVTDIGIVTDSKTVFLYFIYFIIAI